MIDRTGATKPGFDDRVRDAIAWIDARIQAQLAEIMQAAGFRQLEGAWRGLRYLVMSVEGAPSLEIRVLNVSKRMLEDERKRNDHDYVWPRLCGLLYREYYAFDGQSYGVLIGDYEFGDHRDDIKLLSSLASDVEGPVVPFIAAASAKLFGIDEFRSLGAVQDITKTFASRKRGRWGEYENWNDLRRRENSRFLCLTLPRVQLRVRSRDPAGPAEPSSHQAARPAPTHDHHCSINGAYVIGALLARTYIRDGWWAAPYGDGARADVPPAPMPAGDTGRAELTMDVAIPDQRAEELAALGFTPLCDKGFGIPVGFGRGTVHLPSGQSAGAADLTGLSGTMAVSRLAHYLMVISRETCLELGGLAAHEAALNRWIGGYVNPSADLGPEESTRFPLRDARIRFLRKSPHSETTVLAELDVEPRMDAEETTKIRCVVPLRCTVLD